MWYNLSVRVYAHWLDPEFRNALDGRVAMLERSLKVHALLGDTLVLSDIQLIDSPIVYRLFVKPEFRQFLRDFPEFMQVVAQPRHGSGRYSIVTQGLERTARPGWVSSSVKVPGLHARLAHTILQAEWVDPALWQSEAGKRLLADAGEHGNDLRGILHCLSHFANGSEDVIVRVPQQTSTKTFYRVLIDLRDRADLGAEDRRQIEATLEWIDANIEEKDRDFRSAVIGRMGDAVRTPEQQTIRNTVIQAWNCAVEATLAPDAGSAGYLPHSPLIGAYLNVPYNGLLGIDRQAGKASQIISGLPGRVSSVEWDPLAMNWTRLREIANATSDERLALQNAANRSHDSAPLERLIAAISRCERDRTDRIPGSAAALVDILANPGGAALGVLFGATAGTVAGTVASAGPTAAAGTAVGIAATYGGRAAAKFFLGRSRRFRIVNTLRHEFAAVIGDG
jgi:hypothetical protein